MGSGARADAETGTADLAAAAVTGLRMRAAGRPGRLFRTPYELIAPSLLLLAVLVYLPMVVAFLMSVFDLNQYTIGEWTQAPFGGLRHYVDALDPRSPLSGSMLNSIRISLLFAFGTTVIILPIGLGAALLFNTDLRGRAVFRGILLLPYIIPTFVNGIVWRMIFMKDSGPVDHALAMLHLGSRSTYWLIGPNAFWAMLVADVWAAWPFVYMMSLAALQTIPGDLYEAARIDGAGALRAFRFVTLPLLWPTLSLALLLSTINHFNNFALPFVMFGATPPESVDVLPLNIYLNSFVSFNFSAGAAMSVIALLVTLIPAVLYLRATGLGNSE